MLGSIVRLTDPVGGKGVGFGDVGPRREVRTVDRLRNLGFGQREDVVVALLVARQPQRPSIVSFAQFPVLDLGAERPVGDQDALGRFGEELLSFGHATSSSAATGCLGRIPSMWQIA